MLCANLTYQCSEHISYRICCVTLGLGMLIYSK